MEQICQYFITGISEKNINMDINSGENKYDEVNGVLASGTGNIYGIYDLSGGAYERVTGYYKGSSKLENGTIFASQNKKSDKYSTVYEGTTTNGYYKYGDATVETNNWDSDSAAFISFLGPFFVRGGNYSNKINAGIFNFISDDGYNGNNYGFRICLSV